MCFLGALRTHISKCLTFSFGNQELGLLLFNAEKSILKFFGLSRLIMCKMLLLISQSVSGSWESKVHGKCWRDKLSHTFYHEACEESCD